METNNKRKFDQITADAALSFDSAMIALIDQQLHTAKRQRAGSPSTFSSLKQVVVIFESELWYQIISYAVDNIETCRALACTCKGILILFLQSSYSTNTFVTDLKQIVMQDLRKCLQHLRMTDLPSLPTKVQEQAGIFEFHHLDVLNNDTVSLLFKVSAALTNCNTISLCESAFINYDFEEDCVDVEDSSDYYTTLLLKQAFCRYIPSLQCVNLSLAYKSECNFQVSEKNMNQVTTLFCYKPLELYPNLTSLSFSCTLEQMSQMLPVISGSALIRQLKQLQFTNNSATDKYPTSNVIDSIPQYYSEYFTQSLPNFTSLKQFVIKHFFRIDSVNTMLVELLHKLVFQNRMNQVHLCDNFHIKINDAMVILVDNIETKSLGTLLPLLYKVKSLRIGGSNTVLSDEFWKEFYMVISTDTMILHDLRNVEVICSTATQQSACSTDWLHHLIGIAPGLEQVHLVGCSRVDDHNVDQLIRQVQEKGNNLRKLTVPIHDSISLLTSLKLSRLQHDGSNCHYTRVNNDGELPISKSQYNNEEKSLAVSVAPSDSDYNYMSNFSKLEKLAFDNVTLSSEQSVLQIGSVLQHLHHITELSFESTNIPISDFTIILRHTPKLKILNMNSNTSYSLEQFGAFRSALIRNVPMLQELYLASCELKDETFKLLLFNLLQSETAQQQTKHTSQYRKRALAGKVFEFNEQELLWHKLQRLVVLDLSNYTLPNDDILATINTALTNRSQCNSSLKYLQLGYIQPKLYPHLSRAQYDGNALRHIGAAIDELPPHPPYFMDNLFIVEPHKSLYLHSQVKLLESQTTAANIIKKAKSNNTIFNHDPQEKPLPSNTYYFQIPFTHEQLLELFARTAFGPSTCYANNATGNSWELKDTRKFGITNELKSAVAGARQRLSRVISVNLHNQRTTKGFESFRTIFNTKNNTVLEMDRLIINTAGFSGDVVDFAKPPSVPPNIACTSNQPAVTVDNQSLSKYQYYFGTLIVLLPSAFEGGDIVFNFTCENKTFKVVFNKNSIPVASMYNSQVATSQTKSDTLNTDETKVAFPCVAVPKGTKCTIEMISSGAQCLLTFNIFDINATLYDLQRANLFFTVMDKVKIQLDQYFEQQRQQSSVIEPIFIVLKQTNQLELDDYIRDILKYGHNLYFMQLLSEKFKASILPLQFKRNKFYHYPLQYNVKNLITSRSVGSGKATIGSLTIAHSGNTPFATLLDRCEYENDIREYLFLCETRGFKFVQHDSDFLMAILPWFSPDYTEESVDIVELCYLVVEPKTSVVVKDESELVPTFYLRR